MIKYGEGFNINILGLFVIKWIMIYLLVGMFIMFLRGGLIRLMFGIGLLI